MVTTTPSGTPTLPLLSRRPHPPVDGHVLCFNAHLLTLSSVSFVCLWWTFYWKRFTLYFDVFSECSTNVDDILSAVPLYLLIQVNLFVRSCNMSFPSCTCLRTSVYLFINDLQLITTLFLLSSLYPSSSLSFPSVVLSNALRFLKSNIRQSFFFCVQKLVPIESEYKH